MKKKYYALAIALVISGFVVMGFGTYLKYGLLRDFSMVQDKTPVELPFLLIADRGLRYGAKMYMEKPDAPTEPALEESMESTEGTTTPTEVPATTAAAQPQTEPTTVPATEETTEPSTEATTVPTVETLPPETNTEAMESTEGTDPTEPTYDDPDFSVGGVEDSWFDDALFIGNSRVVGLRDYAKKGNARYFCTVGMTVFDVLETYVTEEGHGTQSLYDVLAEKQYGKVFISLGINECGYPYDSVMMAYGELINTVRQAQPEATIILQAILTVSREKAQEGDYFLPENLAKLSSGYASFANGEDIRYIDFNEAFADEDGYMPKHMSWDGCHLYAKYLTIWADWMAVKAKEMGI